MLARVADARQQEVPSFPTVNQCTNMMLQLQPQEFDLLYDKAKTDYLACINDPENAHLQAEVPFPLRDIAIREHNVKIVFLAGGAGVDQLEVHLGLYADGKWMGNYVSILNATGEVIDTNLGFH